MATIWTILDFKDLVSERPTGAGWGRSRSLVSGVAFVAHGDADLVVLEGLYGGSI